MPFARADATAPPFDDDTVDVVPSNHVLEHVVDPGALLAEIAQVVRPGGTRRSWRAVALAIRREPTRLHHRGITPNFAHNWMPDATAATSVEPHEVDIWYVSRGFRCANRPSLVNGIFLRTGRCSFRPSAQGNARPDRSAGVAGECDRVQA